VSHHVLVEGNSAVLDTVTGEETLDVIWALLEQMWFSHDHVPESVRTEMEIAVGEISANIIEHAAKQGPVRLRMEVRVLPDKVEVSFVDDGPPARVDVTAPPPMPDHMAESGRGLALAQAVLGRLQYHRSAVNHWTLVSRQFA
jgi:serine/threonine-protein kinase RsbW